MKKTTFGNRKIPNTSISSRWNQWITRSSSREDGHNFSPRKRGNIFKKIFSGIHISFKRIIGVFLILTIIGGFMIWWLFLRDAPPIENVKNPDNFKESTIVYDVNDNEIYRFSENGIRTYVWYDQISDDIKNAIIATEDPGFFENPGIDVLGLFRAGMNYVTGKSSRIQGTSTLSQQLIKNTILTNERSIKRKVQEAYLAYQLNKKYSKEEILEMYLNAIEFGHGANGIEQASKTFFGKSAKDVGPLGASILASLPKWPTLYSPYSNRGNLMGKIEAYPTDTPKNRILLSVETSYKEYAPLYTQFRSYIEHLTYKKKGNNSLEICGLKKDFSGDPKFMPNTAWCIEVSFSDVLNVLGGIQVKWNLSINNEAEENYTIEYSIGRKDYVAVQMLKEDKISPEVFSRIIYDGLEFQFNKPTQAIKYPYFVMYVKEELETKYGKDLNITEGLKVYTTINPKLQEAAEEIIKDQVYGNSAKKIPSNKQTFNAGSASLISMDNTSGAIVAMVGGPDYFDEKNGGNNNMTTAYRQPGSSFKPLLYGLAISKHPIGPQSPVVDAETKFGTYAPNNYDNKFNGMMTVATALAYSRNIPAVKMYFLAGQEKEVRDFSKKVGIKFLWDNIAWPSISLWSAEVRAIDMMQAYSVFANNGIKKESYAIRKIVDSQGGIIEEKKDNPGQEVFSPAAAYIVNSILSNPENMPNSGTWRANLTVSGKTVAAKTGTANKPKNKSTGKILPGDTWTIGYSPNYTTVVWAGNVDGSPLKGNCDGINCAAPAWDRFMTFALKDLPNVPFKAPTGLLKYKTAKTSGLLADNGIENIMAVELKEKDVGGTEVRMNKFCNQPATDDTPEDAVVLHYITKSKPIIDGFDAEWLKAFYKYANIAETPEETNENIPCNTGNVNISSKLTGVGNTVLEISWSGDREISKVIIRNNDNIIKESTLEIPARSGSDRINIANLWASATVEIIDSYGYKYSKILNTEGMNNENPELPSMLEEARNIEPTISISNPARGSISLYTGDPFNLRFSVSTGTTKRTVSVSINGTVVATPNNDVPVYATPISTEWLSPGNHTITINLTDGNGKTATQNITLSILER